jgi:hypothetical protein
VAEFDINKLSTGDKVVGIGAIVYLISMFLPWYGFSEAGFSVDNSGWSYFLGGIIPLILILAVAAVIAIKRFSPSTNLPTLPVPWSQAMLIASAAAAVIVILRLAITSDDIGGFSNIGIDLDRKYGLFVAVLAAIAVAVGAFMKYQTKEDDTATPSGPPTSF